MSPKGEDPRLTPDPQILAASLPRSLLGFGVVVGEQTAPCVIRARTSPMRSSHHRLQHCSPQTPGLEARILAPAPPHGWKPEVTEVLSPFPRSAPTPGVAPHLPQEKVQLFRSESLVLPTGAGAVLSLLPH